MKRASWLMSWMLGATVALAQTQVDLPDAKDVVSSYVDAIGGEAVLETTKAVVSKGTFELVGMGVTGVLESYRALPNLQYDRIEIEGLGVQEQGFDGNVAWERSTMLGPDLLEGERRALAELDAEMFPELHYDRLYESVSTVAEVDFAGTPCYEVLAITREKHERHLFFARDSSLLIGMRENRPTEMGKLDVQVQLDVYEEFGGIKVPTVSELTVLGQTQRIVIDSISFEEIDPARFALPDDVKVLLEEDSY